MKRSTLRWPFPEGLTHRPDIFPCHCAACRDRRMAHRIGDFDGRPAPIHGPDVEVGDEFDTHGAGGMYREGWLHPGDPEGKRKDRLRWHHD